MAYVPVPKDLTKVKTKVALNLTKRQLIFFSLAAVVGIPFYLVMRKPIGSSIAAILMVTIMLPFFFMAMYENRKSVGRSRNGIVGNRKTFLQLHSRVFRIFGCCRMVSAR